MNDLKRKVLSVSVENTSYGMVKIIDGDLNGRIGYYDNDETEEDGNDIAVVYFGNPLFLSDYELVPYDYLTHEITTNDLYERQSQIFKEVAAAELNHDYKEKSILLSEFLFIESLFTDKYLNARFSMSNNGKKIFISHSSYDKTFVRLLATDLAKAGHQPWLDEWAIRVGQSIPKEVSKGIEECDYVIVVLSKNSVESTWVENEWQAKYWDEVKEDSVKIIPVLIEECAVPKLLVAKKYANFTKKYNHALKELLFALR